MIREQSKFKTVRKYFLCPCIFTSNTITTGGLSVFILEIKVSNTNNWIFHTKNNELTKQ